MDILHNKILVLVLHGGQSNGGRVDDGILYREMIKNTFSTDKGNPIWTEHLDEVLDDSKFEVLAPIFPHGHDMIYTERARFLDQLLMDLNYLKYENVIFVSHSLGTIFLQKYLAENSVQDKFDKIIKQVHFVAATKDYGDFTLSANWENITAQIESENIYLYYSKDDPKCEIEDTMFYKENIGNASLQMFEDRGHFTQDSFPELVLNINKLRN